MQRAGPLYPTVLVSCVRALHLCRGNGQELFQACRGWTIALFQHITENDFLISLLGQSLDDLASVISELPGEDDDASQSRRRTRRRLSLSQRHVPHERLDAGGKTTPSEHGRWLDAAVDEQHEGELNHPRSPPRTRSLQESASYDSTVNAAADVFTTTAGAAAFESALPSTVRIVSEGYLSTAYDGVELTVAREDLAGLVENNNVSDVLRGAVLSPAMAVGTHHVAAISNLSPLFKLPVDAVQRGRDHGLPTYNAVREVSQQHCFY